MINSYTKKSKGSISKLFYNGKDRAIRHSRSKKSSVIKKTLTKIISQYHRKVKMPLINWDDSSPDILWKPELSNKQSKEDI